MKKFYKEEQPKIFNFEEVVSGDKLIFTNHTDNKDWSLSAGKKFSAKVGIVEPDRIELIFPDMTTFLTKSMISNSYGLCKFNFPLDWEATCTIKEDNSLFYWTLLAFIGLFSGYALWTFFIK